MVPLSAVYVRMRGLLDDMGVVSDDLYARRLEACRACDQLNSGTCMGCGCLVELKAAYKNEKCPYKKW